MTTEPDRIGTGALPQRLSYPEVIAMVARLANRADRVAAALRELREPEAAAVVARLADDATQAAAALRELLVTAPRVTDWYQVHREMWVRYGDPGDLTAMTEHVTPDP